jgi:hypothetical protein
MQDQNQNHKSRRGVPLDVRCRCGALLFRALGASDVEVKCRRCGACQRYQCPPPSRG